jgi:hypothetical protein
MAMEESVMEQPELPFYYERSSEIEEPTDIGPESSIDRMQWSSTTSSSETE